MKQINNSLFYDKKSMGQGKLSFTFHLITSDERKLVAQADLLTNPTTGMETINWTKYPSVYADVITKFMNEVKS